jgi:hypothetical protein
LPVGFDFRLDFEIVETRRVEPSIARVPIGLGVVYVSGFILGQSLS